MLQFNQGKKTKRVIALREKAENTFLEQLDITIEKIHAKEHLNKYTNNQGRNDEYFDIDRVLIR